MHPLYEKLIGKDTAKISLFFGSILLFSSSKGTSVFSLEGLTGVDSSYIIILPSFNVINDTDDGSISIKFFGLIVSILVIIR